MNEPRESYMGLAHGDEHLQGFSIDSVSAEAAERELERRSQKRIQDALEYARPLVDEPFMTVLHALNDEFGLTAKELETVIHKWTVEGIATLKFPTEFELDPADVLRAYEGQI